ncbi:HTTM domain-containing protein [Agrobacterium tumefaciens]|nr:HTTM domain-containing protein [Agrobacterium tumefaciens]NTE22205.1 HTTM domain-containing protein [Agrobacterium tumefaciens]
MIKRLEKKLNSLTVDYFPYTNVIGLARTLIAVGTLLTLICNPVYTLFNTIKNGKVVNPLLSGDIPINDYNFFTLFGFENIIYTKIAAILILVLVISGRFIRVSGILHWWVTTSFMLSASIIDGGDQIGAIITLLLIPHCLTDGRKSHWTKVEAVPHPANIIGITSIILIRIQVFVIYFHAAVGKLNVAEWINGTAIYYWLNHSAFGMPLWLSHITNPLLKNSLFVSALTYGCILFEIILCMSLLASSRFKKNLLVFAITFHILIIFYHGIFSFFFAISSGLVIYLYPFYRPINFRHIYEKTFKRGVFA